jgi:glycosyltransferase involved in cell wall biosynthesis
MTIAINIRFWQTGPMTGFGNFVKEITTIWIEENPDYQFVLITDNDNHGIIDKQNNVKVVKVGLPAKTPALWKLWYNVSVPLALKKYKPDVFVSPDAMCSTTLGIPQVIVVHDVSYLHLPNMFPKTHLRFFKNNIPQMLQKAKAIATVSEHAKLDIATQYTIDLQKISVVYSGIKPDYQPLAYNEIQATRDLYSNGLPYFIHIGTITPRKNIVNLLKAFSLFKQRQQSSLKLVLAGGIANSYKAFKELLAHYKYASDVIHIENATDAVLQQLLGAAYALVYPSLYEGFGVPPLEAMQAGVPAIVASSASIPEICGEAALYIDAEDVQSIYEGLKEIYVHEDLKEKLVRQGIIHCKQYTWQRAAALLWNTVMQTIKP